MIHHRKLVPSPLKTVLLIGVGLLTQGCEETPTSPLPVDTTGLGLVEAFLATQTSPGPWRADTLVADSLSDALIFVAYRDRPPPGYYGLVHDGRIGWLIPPEGARKHTLFDIHADDDALFGPFLQVVESTLQWGPYSVRLASDRHTPDTTLFRLAWGLLRQPTGPDVAAALLDNPRAMRNLKVLQYVALAGRPTPVWERTYDPAWERVAEAQGGIGTWEPGGFMTQSVDQVRIHVHFGNHDSIPLAIAYPDACYTDILVFGPEGYEGLPVWDQGAAREANSEPCEYSIRYDLMPVGWAFQRSTRPASIADILGDTLPAGAYHFAVRFRFFEPADTTLFVPMGPRVLSR